MDKETHIIELTTDMISAGWDDEVVPPPTPPKPAEIETVFENEKIGEPVLGSELEIMDTDKPEAPDGWTIIDDNEITKYGDCYLLGNTSPYDEPDRRVNSELGKKASEAKANHNKYLSGLSLAVAIIRKEKLHNKEPEQEKPKPQAPSEWRLLDKGEVLRDDDEMDQTGVGLDENAWVSCDGWGGKVIGIHADTIAENWQFRRRIGKTPEVPLPQLPPPSDDNQSGKNLTRQLKCYCEESGYICRTTQKWLNKYGPPISPANNKPMKVEQKDDNNE